MPLLCGEKKGGRIIFVRTTAHANYKWPSYQCWCCVGFLRHSHSMKLLFDCPESPLFEVGNFCIFCFFFCFFVDHGTHPKAFWKKHFLVEQKQFNGAKALFGNVMEQKHFLVEIESPRVCFEPSFLNFSNIQKRYREITSFWPDTPPSLFS